MKSCGSQGVTLERKRVSNSILEVMQYVLGHLTGKLELFSLPADVLKRKLYHLSAKHTRYYRVVLKEA